MPRKIRRYVYDRERDLQIQRRGRLTAMIQKPPGRGFNALKQAATDEQYSSNDIMFALNHAEGLMQDAVEYARQHCPEDPWDEEERDSMLTYTDRACELAVELDEIRCDPNAEVSWSFDREEAGPLLVRLVRTRCQIYVRAKVLLEARRRKKEEDVRLWYEEGERTQARGEEMMRASLSNEDVAF